MRPHLIVREKSYRGRAGWLVTWRDASGRHRSRVFVARGHEVVGLRRQARRYSAADAGAWLMAIWCPPKVR